MSNVTISALSYYPIKSCAGTKATSARLVDTGFAFDRYWMVVDDTGMFVTQRERPELALVKPQVRESTLTLEAAGHSATEVSVKPSSVAIDAAIFGERYQALTTSPDADRWFSDFLGAPHRLVAFDSRVLRRGGVQYPSRDNAPTYFTDNFGLLIISENSFADLNRRMPTPLPFNRFRPNIVISGLDAFEEDYVTTLKGRSFKLRFNDLCYRCNLTTISQETAESGPEPIKTLTTYRFDEKIPGVKFGAYFSVETGVDSTLNVGDELQVELNY